MDFKELQDEVSELLNFNSTQTDQDFTTAQIKRAINRAYRREYNKARHEGSRRYFQAVTEFTWSADQVTLTLPSNIRRAQLISLEDITDNASGTRIVVYDGGDPPTGTPAWVEQNFREDIRWKDRNTLQWGNNGPGSARTLRAAFFPEPESLSEDQDSPDLVGPAHHELIFYSAAIDLRTRADEAAPNEWMREVMSLRVDFHKDVSRGRPTLDGQTIEHIF